MKQYWQRMSNPLKVSGQYIGGELRDRVLEDLEGGAWEVAPWMTAEHAGEMIEREKTRKELIAWLRKGVPHRSGYLLPDDPVGDEEQLGDVIEAVLRDDRIDSSRGRSAALTRQARAFMGKDWL